MIEYKTYYLKATSADALWTAMETAGLAYKIYDPSDVNNQRPDPVLGQDNSWTPSGDYIWGVIDFVNVDEIGTIYVKTGSIDPDTGTEAWEALDDNYYANMKCQELTQAQKDALPLIDAPASPYRVFAGD